MRVARTAHVAHAGRAALVALAALLAALAGCVETTERPAGTTTAPSPADSSAPGTASTSPARTTVPAPEGWSPGAWRDRPCSPTPSATVPEPDLVLLLRGGGVASLAWNGTAYEERASGAATAMHLAILGQDLYTADEGMAWTLTKRGLDLAPKATVAVPPVGAMAAADGTLFVATNWNLTTYAPDLAQRGRVAITPPHDPWMKALDAVEVHAGTAYVVDDVVMPFYAFRVDVRDPADPRLAATHQVDGSSSPRDHWLAKDGTWFLESNFGGMGGGSSTAVGFTATGPGPSVPLQAYTMPAPGTPGLPTVEGYGIQASGFRLPAWAVLARPGLAELARIDFNGTTPERSCAIPLWPGASVAAEHAGLLAVAGAGHLALLRADGTRVHDQDAPYDPVALHIVAR